MTSAARAKASSDVNLNFGGSDGDTARVLEDPALAAGLEGPAAAAGVGFFAGGAAAGLTTEGAGAEAAAGLAPYISAFNLVINDFVLTPGRANLAGGPRAGGAEKSSNSSIANLPEALIGGEDEEATGVALMGGDDGGAEAFGGAGCNQHIESIRLTFFAGKEAFAAPGAPFAVAFAPPCLYRISALAKASLTLPI